MKNHTGKVFLALAIAIMILAILYGFGIVSEWKIAVVTISAAIFTFIDTNIQAIRIQTRLKNNAQRLKSISEPTAKPKQKRNGLGFWEDYLYCIPLIALIVGLAFEPEKTNNINVNMISAFGVSSSLIALFQRYSVFTEVIKLEKRTNQMVTISEELTELRKEFERIKEMPDDDKTSEQLLSLMGKIDHLRDKNNSLKTECDKEIAEDLI